MPEFAEPNPDYAIQRHASEAAVATS